MASFAQSKANIIEQVSNHQGVIVIWSDVAAAIRNWRTNVQCLQWYNKHSTDPNKHGHREAISGCMKGPWMEEEDQKVIELIQK